VDKKLKNAIDMMGAYQFKDYITIMFITCVFVVGLEKVVKFVFNYIEKYHLKKVEKENEKKTINDIVNRIEEFANLMNRQYQHLEKRLGEQKEHLETLETDGKKRDCAILRDRILQAVKYFRKNTIDNEVHINIIDWENLNAMFEEYFKANGNGAIKKIYEEEFKNWVIDN
jgi:hypothetical protein